MTNDIGITLTLDIFFKIGNNFIENELYNTKFIRILRPMNTYI